LEQITNLYGDTVWWIVSSKTSNKLENLSYNYT